MGVLALSSGWAAMRLVGVEVGRQVTCDCTWEELEPSNGGETTSKGESVEIKSAGLEVSSRRSQRGNGGVPRSRISEPSGKVVIRHSGGPACD